jgi:zinc-ribbon domain
MSEPEIEIARRCTFCGISVREQAMFCPQCGNPIKSHQAAPTSISLSDTIIDSPPAETVPAEPAPKPVPVVHKPAEPGVRARVEHIRKVSSVMIDQAAYDPSLRFLLVAAAFFILFLVLLILSKVIG